VLACPPVGVLTWSVLLSNKAKRSAAGARRVEQGQKRSRMNLAAGAGMPKRGDARGYSDGDTGYCATFLKTLAPTHALPLPVPRTHPTMATTMPIRSQPFPPTTVSDRRSSLSSAHGSHRSSHSFSRPIRHSKAPSQQSASIRSPIGSVRSQAQRPTIATAENGGRRRRSQRLKSQYPVDDSEPHVEYILVASFDIDRGPTMEHQFPGIISPDENLLAELMLPDQTHTRTQDWTIFFLHKNSGEDEEAQAAKEASKRQRLEEREQRRVAGEDVEESDDEDDGREGPSMM